MGNPTTGSACIISGMHEQDQYALPHNTTRTMDIIKTGLHESTDELSVIWPWSLTQARWRSWTAEQTNRQTNKERPWNKKTREEKVEGEECQATFFCASHLKAGRFLSSAASKCRCLSRRCPAVDTPLAALLVCRNDADTPSRWLGPFHVCADLAGLTAGQTVSTVRVAWLSWTTVWPQADSTLDWLDG